jgi:hypothetical protein
MQSLSGGDPEWVALWPGHTPPVHLARGTPIRDATGIPSHRVSVAVPQVLQSVSASRDAGPSLALSLI